MSDTNQPALSPEDFGRISHKAVGAQCRTCLRPAWVDVVRRVLDVWNSPEGARPSLTALHRYMVDHHQYPHGEHALRAHVQKHEHELWAAVAARHGL